jgi:hypothetical protein
METIDTFTYRWTISDNRRFDTISKDEKDDYDEKIICALSPYLDQFGLFQSEYYHHVDTKHYYLHTNGVFVISVDIDIKVIKDELSKLLNGLIFRIKKVTRPEGWYWYWRGHRENYLVNL